MWAEVRISPYLTALLVSGDPDSAPWYFVTVRILRRPQNHSTLLSISHSQLYVGKLNAWTFCLWRTLLSLVAVLNAATRKRGRQTERVHVGLHVPPSLNEEAQRRYSQSLGPISAWNVYIRMCCVTLVRKFVASLRLRGTLTAFYNRQNAQNTPNSFVLLRLLALTILCSLCSLQSYY